MCTKVDSSDAPSCRDNGMSDGVDASRDDDRVALAASMSVGHFGLHEKGKFTIGTE